MHPHALLRMSLVVTVAFIACFTMSGCGKQQKAAPAKMPQVSKTAAADTADIFKEFYSEDSTKNKAGGKSKKGAKQETFSPSSSSSSFQPEFSPKGRYTVQITCVRSKSFAAGMTGKMKDKGYPAYVAEVQNPTPNLSGTFYRVRIGGFDGLSAAKSFGENILVAGGYQYWVDKKSNDNVGMEGYGLGSGSAGSSAASSYDNVPAAVTTPAPAATPTSSYESPNSTYSSPSSSSSGASNATTSAAPASSSTAPASPASSAASPAPAASSTPAASTAPAGTQAGSSTGATTGKSSTGSSTESGWGTDSTSKSGW